MKRAIDLYISERLALEAAELSALFAGLYDDQDTEVPDDLNNRMQGIIDEIGLIRLDALCDSGYDR